MALLNSSPQPASLACKSRHLGARLADLRAVPAARARNARKAPPTTQAVAEFVRTGQLRQALLVHKFAAHTASVAAVLVVDDAGGRGALLKGRQCHIIRCLALQSQRRELASI